MEQSHPDYLRLPLAARLAGDYGAGGATAVVHLAEYFALGTSITPMSDSHVLPTPQMVLSLNDTPLKISESRFIQSEEK